MKHQTKAPITGAFLLRCHLGHCSINRVTYRIKDSKWPHQTQHLQSEHRAVMFCPVVAKSTIGRRNPFKLQATQTPKASFFVSGTRAPSGQHGPLFMVTLVGQPLGWSVSCNADIPTPINVTANRKRRNLGGNLLTQLQEAADMATVTPPAIPKIFTFLVAPSACRLVEMTSIQAVSAIAGNEQEARALLAGLPLVFQSRKPAGRAAA